MVNQRFFSRLAYSASFFALGVILLGAFTRWMDAGLGCPDWPGCYGHLIAPMTSTKAWTEMIHRYFVGMLSLFIMMIVIMIFSKKLLRTRFNVMMAIFLMLLLSYQIILGQWTVTLKLLPVIVSQHLLGGYLILSTLWLLYLNNSAPSSLNHRAIAGNSMALWAILGLFLLLTQILLGAWTSTNYASLSCTDFPFCLNDQSMTWHFKQAFNLVSPIGMNYDGGVLPIAIRQTIHMTHRLGAVIITLYFILFIAMASLPLKHRPDLLKGLYIVLGLLCVQLCIGISNVIFKLPLITAISHTIIAALVWIAWITFIFKLRDTRPGGVT